MADLASEEYQSCRNLFLENVRAIERNEIYCIGASAVVIVFALAQQALATALPAAFVPLFVNILGRMRFIGFGIIASTLNDYLQKLEEADASIGWVSFQRGQQAGGPLQRSRFLLWRMLIGLSAVFPIVVILQALLRIQATPI